LREVWSGLYATGLDQARLIRAAPNDDSFVVETKTGEIRVFGGITTQGFLPLFVRTEGLTQQPGTGRNSFAV
jgi:hypothetical protein